MRNQTIRVRVAPKASSNRIVKKADLWRVYVTAAPEDGKANAAVLKLLAKELGVPKTSLRISKGETSRDKTVEVSGPA